MSVKKLKVVVYVLKILIMAFYMLNQVEMCCWESYKQHREKQEKLKYFRIPHDELEDPSTSLGSDLFEEDEERPSKWSRIKFKVWRALEEPYSSRFAKVTILDGKILQLGYIWYEQFIQ